MEFVVEWMECSERGGVLLEGVEVRGMSGGAEAERLDVKSWFVAELCCSSSSAGCGCD